jgi:hypothetical protein
MMDGWMDECRINEGCINDVSMMDERLMDGEASMDE